MSLVRPTRGNRKLYSLNGSKKNSAFPTSMVNSKRNVVFVTESYRSDSYDQKYFTDSPSDEILHQSSSSIHENDLNAQGASSNQIVEDMLHSSYASLSDYEAYRADFELEYLNCCTPEAIVFDEDKMRLKLQELERALLEGNDEDDSVFCSDHSMEIDGDWADPVRNPMPHDSPKESSSADSNISSISSNKEVSLDSTHITKKMLFDCASTVSDGNISRALNMINDLRQRVSIQGEPSERIAAYMVEALAARLATSGKGLYKALKCKEPPSLDRLSAMQTLFEVCPCFRFGLVAANDAIIEAFKNERRVHIIDFEISQGSQYIELLQTLANQPGKLPYLKLTGIDDPESVQRATGGLKLIGQRLEELAKMLKVPFEFRAIAAKTETVTPAILDCLPGEALIVNFAFQLHHMPDESVSTVNERDKLLRMIKSMNPKLVTVVEQDVNTNTAPFLPRFVEAYNYYSAVFELLDATLPRESQDRMNVEKHCLARDIVNVVACEGEERIERYELSGKWRARMMMAGFGACPISPNVNDTIRKLIKRYCDRFTLKEETGAFHFGWEDKVLVVASAWR